MNEEDFQDVLSRFVERPVPALAGRHVYLWHGDVNLLGRTLPNHAVRTLDLHALAASLPKSPSSMDGARSVLLPAIRLQLNDLLASERQQVLVVTGCDLLSRYRVPLVPFFEIASEHTAVVFAISPAETHFQPSEPLPEYVSWNARAPLDYLRSALGKESVITTAVEEAL